MVATANFDAKTVDTWSAQRVCLYIHQILSAWGVFLVWAAAALMRALTALGSGSVSR